MSKSSAGAAAHHHESTMIETLQSLIVAFVLAMTFRGFVTEGFVIPTGSMAPTLLGQHVLMHSEQTGVTFPVGVDPDHELPRERLADVADPMLGMNYPGSGTGRSARRRMGDRILVLKSLYPFAEPHRYDVVVFKNPTDPTGKSANYIKRLIGLPNEKVWLADGDVFAAPNEDGTTAGDFRIQRKPFHVQQAVWQPIHDSDFVPTAPDRLSYRYAGVPWRGASWDTSGRSYRCDTAAPSRLEWDTGVRPLNDWTCYDSVGPRATGGINDPLFPVTDLRVEASVLADDPAQLRMTFEIEARDHRFQFLVGGGTGVVRMQPLTAGPDDWLGAEPVDIDLPDAGEPFNVEFWHVDQSLSVFINDDLVAEHRYEWTGRERAEYALGVESWQRLVDLKGDQPRLSWSFAGSPVTLERVRLDRDLYYRPASLAGRARGKALANPTPANSPAPEVVEDSPYAFATHPDNPGVLGPDHFMMLGDNSQASLDSRLWGNPHPLVAAQVDASPFLVHRELIIGKAWVVYFPAPFPVTTNGLPVVPDFGRLRFIR